MTTIVITPTHVAHDARVTNPRGLIVKDDLGKSIGWKGDVYMGVGNGSVFLSIMYHIVTGKPHPRWKIDDSGLVIISRADGTMESLCAKPNKAGGFTLEFNPIVATPVCFGSGGDWATAALDMGKGAEEAVEYAMTRDNCSGGHVTVIPRNRDEVLPNYNLEWLTGGNLKTLMAYEEEQSDGHSMEMYSLEEYKPNSLFKLSPIANTMKSSYGKVATIVSNLEERILGPFQTIKSNWGFQIGGDLRNLDKVANNNTYVDWLRYEFHKPQGMTSSYVAHQRAMIEVLKLLGNVDKDYIRPLMKHTNRFIGNPNDLTKVSKTFTDIDIEPTQYREPLTKTVNRDDVRTVTSIEDLVKNNQEWRTVQENYTIIIELYKQLKPEDILDDSERLAKSVMELTAELKRLEDKNDIVATANYKHLIKQLEALAFVVDTVGVMGYLIQQLETALYHNYDMMHKAK